MEPIAAAAAAASATVGDDEETAFLALQKRMLAGEGVPALRDLERAMERLSPEALDRNITTEAILFVAFLADPERTYTPLMRWQFRLLRVIASKLPDFRGRLSRMDDYAQLWVLTVLGVHQFLTNNRHASLLVDMVDEMAVETSRTPMATDTFWRMFVVNSDALHLDAIGTSFCNLLLDARWKASEIPESAPAFARTQMEVCRYHYFRNSVKVLEMALRAPRIKCKLFELVLARLMGVFTTSLPDEDATHLGEQAELKLSCMGRVSEKRRDEYAKWDEERTAYQLAESFSDKDWAASAGDTTTKTRRARLQECVSTLECLFENRLAREQVRRAFWPLFLSDDTPGPLRRFAGAVCEWFFVAPSVYERYNGDDHLAEFTPERREIETRLLQARMAKVRASMRMMTARVPDEEVLHGALSLLMQASKRFFCWGLPDGFHELARLVLLSSDGMDAVVRNALPGFAGTDLLLRTPVRASKQDWLWLIQYAFGQFDDCRVFRKMVASVTRAITEHEAREDARLATLDEDTRRPPGVLGRVWYATLGTDPRRRRSLSWKPILGLFAFSTSTNYDTYSERRDWYRRFNDAWQHTRFFGHFFRHLENPSVVPFLVDLNRTIRKLDPYSSTTGTGDDDDASFRTELERAIARNLA